MADGADTEQRGARSSPRLDPGLSQQQLFAYARDLREALATSRRTADALERTHVETVAALASAVDARDSITGGHVHRVANYGAILAETLAPELRDDPQLVYGFLLHDIGKIATPDAVLNKPGALTPDEVAVMRQHVPDGIRFVRSVSFLRPALDIIATHHEHVDGSGYPQGLRGPEIPLGARMFIVCDAFDAMIHDRPYREGMPVEQAVEELGRCRGTQFDPDVVDAFEACLPRMLAVPEHPDVPPVRRRPVPERPAGDAATRTAVFDTIDHAIAVLSPGGTIVEANRRFHRLFGLDHVPVGMTLSEIVRRAAGSVQDAEEAAAALRPLERDLLDGERRGRFRDTDGRPHAWRSELLRDPEGNVLGRVVAIQDEPAHGTHETLDPISDVLHRPRPEDDEDWRERLLSARATLSRVGSLVDQLLEDTVQAAEDGEV